ncbi:focadhesin [Epargyreus clarus]|uniref:focadhesin n=1 Tax=Epargyreus clarus TaxID=520877 RepID=UPI003C2F428A
MDEIEYKLKTNNSILVVNAIDKLINMIKSKYKPGERQRFVLENEELKFLREKCSSSNALVSLTACQGLLSLVELGVLEIAHTMSTVVTLLPSTHNYTAIISSMAGLLILDLKYRLVPGEQYKCQFSLRSPQHPFIRVLERNKDAEDDVLAQMHALCTHPDYIVASHSLELLRPVFLWLTYNPQRSSSVRPWQLLLSLPESPAQSTLLLNCISCQQFCNPKLVESAFAAMSAAVDAAVYQQKVEHVMAFLPLLARVSNELIKHGRDPRACYNLIERCFALNSPPLKNVAGLTLMLLLENLINTSALYLHELFNLCLNITKKYEYTAVCLNAFIGLSLQWLHLPSHLTANALKVASQILDSYKQDNNEHYGLHMANLRSNTIYQMLVYTDEHLFTISKLLETYERIRDNPAKLEEWFSVIAGSNDTLKLQLLPFFVGFAFIKQGSENIVSKAIKVVIELVSLKKEVSVAVLPALMYKIANDERPEIKLECLRGLPLMASTKENVPSIVSVLNKLKTNKGVPTSLLIMLYTSLAETQVRCFPYLQEVLVDSGAGRPDDLKWEVDIAKAVAVKRICELRASTHGLELVSVISSILNRCADKGGALATSLALHALSSLWRGNAVAPPSTWRALEPRLGKDNRVPVQIALCKLLAEVPALRVSSPEYDKLVADTARRLWRYIAEGNQPSVVHAACDALAKYNVTDYTLKDVPEIYRKTVKLPASFCKTPADAARKPEDVLDYIPCEVWPEVFKYTNQAALGGVQNLVTALIAREVSSYRSGVYQTEGRAEPQSLGYLPASSVLRGLGDCFRRQVTSPSYDFPEAALLTIFETLTTEYSKPLPPLDLNFLHSAYQKGQHWKAGCFKLAARQASVSPTAKNLVENALKDVDGTGDEFDIMLLFDNLPILCRSIPPNTLRTPIEASLAASFATLPRVKAKNQDSGDHLFIRQLLRIKECLQCDKIHDANRTLLSLTIENYFAIITDDNVAWPTYTEVCTLLSTKYLERMTSPTGWWEVSGELLRKSSAVRSALAAAAGAECRAPLVWLNESVDAHAGELTEQEFSLRCFLPALRAAPPDAEATTEWLLQLMARTQVAFKETDNESSKLYLCDVFMLAVVVFSGHWSFEPDSEALVCNRSTRQAMLPAAAAALAARPAWATCTQPMLEWLCHTRHATQDSATALSCQRALLALRHTEQFATQKVWMRLDEHSALDASKLDKS